MKILLEPGNGKWPFGFGLNETAGEWRVWALSPCCLTSLTWTTKCACSLCGKPFEEGFSDSWHGIKEPFLQDWVRAWLGYTEKDDEVYIRVEVK